MVNDFLFGNIKENWVVYIGIYDNDIMCGWWCYVDESECYNFCVYISSDLGEDIFVW